jgi:hypothetical protein
MFVSVRRAVLGLVAALVLAAVVASPGAAMDRQGPVSPPAGHGAIVPGRGIVLVWFDVLGLMPQGFTEAAEEVGAIFRDTGIEVRWRAGGPGVTYGDGPWPELPVILLTADPLRARRDRNVMGLVVRDHRPPFPIWAFVEPIRGVLGFGKPHRVLLPSERPRLARAVGRVVAHELIHVLAPDHPHDRNGLMRHALDRGSLVGGHPPLTGGCARAVQAGLAALWKDRAASAASAAPAAADLAFSTPLPEDDVVPRIGLGASIDSLLPRE